MRTYRRWGRGAVGRVRGWLVRGAVASYVVVGCVGCAGGGFATQAGLQRQMVISGMVLVDTAQTANFARARDERGEPCFREVNPLAFGGDSHPSVGKVWTHGVLYGLGHWLLGGFLDRKAATDLRLGPNGELSEVANGWRRAQKVYWGLTVGGHGLAIASNARQGIAPFGKVSCE